MAKRADENEMFIVEAEKHITSYERGLMVGRWAKCRGRWNYD